MKDDNADISSYKGKLSGLPKLLRETRIGAFFRPSQLEEAGLTRDQLPAMVRRGVVKHVGRGLYRVAEVEPTEHYSLAMACARVPNGVVCLLSALQVYEIGTQLPHAIWLAIPHKARRPGAVEVRFQIVRFSGAAATYGVQETAFEGVPARITSPARTIVDCFRYERLLGAEATLEALLDALRTRKVTIPELDRVEKVLPSRRLRLELELQSVRSI